MQNKFEAPELTVIGKADEVVMGITSIGNDYPMNFGIDFEFEQDSL